MSFGIKQDKIITAIIEDDFDGTSKVQTMPGDMNSGLLTRYYTGCNLEQLSEETTTTMKETA